MQDKSLGRTCIAQTEPKEVAEDSVGRAPRLRHVTYAFCGVGIFIVVGCIVAWSYDCRLARLEAMLSRLQGKSVVMLRSSTIYHANTSNQFISEQSAARAAGNQGSTSQSMLLQSTSNSVSSNKSNSISGNNGTPTSGHHSSDDGGDLSRIPGCSRVPFPFGQAIAGIYVQESYASWRHSRDLDMLQLGRSDPGKYCGSLSRLLSDGLKWSHFGMDFSDVVQKRGLGWNMDDDIRAAMALYWGKFYDTNFSVIPIDFEMRFRPRDMNMFVYGPRDRFSNFFRDGYIKITDFGVDIGKLKEEIRIAKDAASWHDLLSGDTPWFRNVHLKALDPLISNKAILELASFYMGSDVVVNGYQYHHASANLTTEKMRQTGEWHHDSCGTRVKIFVYLHDVNEDRMVTEIAAGSQTSLKFTFGGVHPWFNTPSVQKTWRVDKMIGAGGGGFLFDPNTIHRASAYKPHLPRDVVIIDISSATKADLGVPSAERPCPLHTWRTEAVNSKFTYPKKGHGPLTGVLVKQNKGRKNYEEYYKEIREAVSDAEYAVLLDQKSASGSMKKSLGGIISNRIKSAILMKRAAKSDTKHTVSTTSPKPKSKSMCAGKGRNCREHGSPLRR